MTDKINREAIRLMARAAGPNKTIATAQAKAFVLANFSALSNDTRVSARWGGFWTPLDDNYLCVNHVVACDEGMFIAGRRVA